MNEGFRLHYETLGAAPGCSWAEVKQAYRRRVQHWHPDRHQTGPDATQAQTRIKEINKAFQALEDYYRAHGQLPSFEQDRLNRAASDHVSSNWGRPIHVGRRPARSALRALALLGVLAFAYAFWADSWHDMLFPTDSPPHSRATATSDSRQGARAYANRGFTIGSPPDEVYAARGVPTKIEGDTWHYGHTKVHFRNGRVVNWTHAPETVRAAPVVPSSSMDQRALGLDNSPFNPLKDK